MRLHLITRVSVLGCSLVWVSACSDDGLSPAATEGAGSTGGLTENGAPDDGPGATSDADDTSLEGTTSDGTPPPMDTTTGGPATGESGPGDTTGEPGATTQGDDAATTDTGETTDGGTTDGTTDGGTTDGGSSDTGDDASPYAGDYAGTITGDCPGIGAVMGGVEFTVADDGTLTGMITDPLAVGITGTVDDAGTIDGGGAAMGVTCTFDGDFSGGDPAGDWTCDIGCVGTWSAQPA